MSDSEQRVVKFLEKEIKTYVALSLFLSKKSTQESFHSRETGADAAGVLQRKNEGNEKTCY